MTLNKNKGGTNNGRTVFQEENRRVLHCGQETHAAHYQDSKTKGSKAVFSLVYYDTKTKNYYTFSWMLRELGFKQSTDDDLFITHCAERYSLFILDNVGQELKRKGMELPEWWDKEIQSQNVI